jgi:OOP family OmpA-OmpF porin
VTVSDGRGGTAQAKCPVRIEEPKKAPEPITCTSGGFPGNLARLNNVDKACLDDVALRVRQDPQSRVVIVGHADKTERYPEVIGRKRAEAVKGYLVGQGVDQAKVTVRSAGATQLLDTGKTAQARAKNRRVEIIFLPAGAVLPEQP